MLAPLDEAVTAPERARFLPETLPPLRFEGSLYGLPLAFKSVALFRNEALVPEAPATTDELLAKARGLSASGRFGLAYPTDSFYFHAPWFFGFGGRLFATQDPVDFTGSAFAASLDFVDRLQRDQLVPEEATTALVAQLFNKERVGMVISGPWFVGEIDDHISYTVSPLPVVTETGLPASPLLTDEAVFVSREARSPETALLLAKHLASDASALIRATVGRQVVANTATWEEPHLAEDPVLTAFRRQLATATPMDNRPAMRDVWEPAQLALKKVLRGSTEVSAAVGAAEARYRAITRPVPPRAKPGPYLALLALAALALCGLALRWLASVRRAGQLQTAARAWAWAGPASVATSVLVFLPFVVGLGIAFFAHREGEWTFVGLANFGDILASAHHRVLEPLSFYYALVVTLAWTVLNVALHLGIGLALALLLNRPSMRLRPLYRVLLILPWAVPNYITALIWKGLFHRQLGAVNGVLEWLGLEGVAWFSSFGTAFFANLCTNVWLGFPFMMVVCLGALQSIPSELYEAADVDGASWLSKLRHITLPLLRPALIPAVLLGTVWTFN
ncbi:MAG TPA: sugar ABC transporter substrate-binding protein, partial [Deltaproteobacteria bacterium]|nr:sugar ABC transporter substrate-binding protein [Deltaproteobacteria bacterium]